MKKKVFLLTMLTCLMSISAEAYPVGYYFVIGNLYYKVTSSTTVSCIEPWSGSPTSVTVPETVKGKILDWDTNQYSGEYVGPYTVTAIGDDYSRDWNSVKTLTLPSTITKFYKYMEFENLETLNMPKNLVSLSSTFYGLENLKKVTFPKDSKLQEIGKNAFLGCTALKEVHLPASLEVIGEQAFADCTSLELVTIPSNSKLTTICKSAFYNCTSLSKMNVNAAAAQIKSILPKGVTDVQQSAFKNCAFSVLELSESLKTIGSGAFSGCKNLTKIRIPQDVYEIGSVAFALCDKLEEIYLPASLAILGSSAFEGCPNIERVYSHREKPYAISYDTFNASIYQNAKLLVHEKSEYKDVYAWSEFKHIMDMDGEYTFENRVYNITATGNGEVVIPKDTDYDLGAGAKLLHLFDGATVRNEQRDVPVCHWAVQFGYNVQFIPDKDHRIKQVLVKHMKDTELKDVTDKLEYQGGRVWTFFVNDMNLSTNPQIVATFESFESKNVEGDFNGDNEVTNDDVIDVVVDVMDPTSDYDEEKDLNHDGVINAADIVETVKIINK